MTKIALITAIVASLAAPAAFAQSANSIATSIVNGSSDNVLEHTRNGLTLGTTASTQNANSITRMAIERANASADNAGDRFDASRATTFSAEPPAHLRDFLAELAAASREDQ